MWSVYLHMNFSCMLEWMAPKCWFLVTDFSIILFGIYAVVPLLTFFFVVLYFRVHQVILALLVPPALQVTSLLPLVTLWDTMMMLWQIHYQSLLKMKQLLMTTIKQTQESMPRWSHWAARLRLCAAQMVRRNTQHGLVMTWSCATHPRRVVSVNALPSVCGIGAVLFPIYTQSWKKVCNTSFDFGLIQHER